MGENDAIGQDTLGIRATDEPGLMTHRETAEDLAMVKGSIYIEVPLGSIWGNPHTQKADVVVW